MFRRLLCWHKWHGWRYSRNASNQYKSAAQSNHCAKCGARKTRKWREAW